MAITNSRKNKSLSIFLVFNVVFMDIKSVKRNNHKTLCSSSLNIYLVTIMAILNANLNNKQYNFEKNRS